MEKEKNKLSVMTGFGVLKPRVDQVGFDKFYIKRKIVPVVKKVGEGEHDFIIVNSVVETKDDIRQLINSQSSQVGIESYMRAIRANGFTEDDLSAHVSSKVADFTKAPETLAEVAELGKNAQVAYSKLDKNLTKGLSLEQFLSSLSQNVLDDYFASLVKKRDDAVEKKEGDK